MLWWWWRPPYVLRTVILNFRDEASVPIGGVLWSSRGPYLTLKQATLDPANQKVALDGDVIVERERLAFVQVVH